MAEASAKLIACLLRSHPLMLAPCVPPVVAPALLQFLAYGDTGLQVGAGWCKCMVW